MYDTVFLVDVDNTLLDNDRIQSDIRAQLEREYGPECRDRYWTIQERLMDQLGYRDYLGALNLCRDERPNDVDLLRMSSFLLDYPFADRLYPGALELLARLRQWGPAVVLTDGDMVFQPRKVARAGIAQAVGGDVLVYIHKEQALDDIERRYPAQRYVLVDDKLRILAAVKAAWGDRVTTVFVRQGQFALDPSIVNACAPADLAVDRIAQLLELPKPVLTGKGAQ